MSVSTIKKVEYCLNLLGVLGISLILLMAFGFQFILGELPCPLCLLQRIGFTLIGLGFLFNLRFGLRPSHYAIVLLSAVYTGVVAVRQVLLHIIPGTGDYGSALFGWHMYTWSSVFALLTVLITTLMFAVDQQYEVTSENPVLYKRWTQFAFALFLLIALLNVVSTFAECGWDRCPDNPVRYWLSFF